MTWDLWGYGVPVRLSAHFDTDSDRKYFPDWVYAHEETDPDRINRSDPTHTDLQNSWFSYGLDQRRPHIERGVRHGPAHPDAPLTATEKFLQNMGHEFATRIHQSAPTEDYIYRGMRVPAEWIDRVRTTGSLRLPLSSFDTSDDTAAYYARPDRDDPPGLRSVVLQVAPGAKSYPLIGDGSMAEHVTHGDFAVDNVRLMEPQEAAGYGGHDELPVVMHLRQRIVPAPFGMPGPGERTATTALEELDDLNDEERRRADDDIADFHAGRHQDTSPYGQLQNHLYDHFMAWWPTSQAAQERDPQTAATNWHYYPDEPITHWLNVEDFLKENYPQSATGAQLGTEQAQHAIRQGLDPDFMHPHEWDKSGLSGTGDHITQAMLSLHNRIQGRTWESPDDERRYYDLMLKHVGPGAPRLARLLTAMRRTSWRYYDDDEADHHTAHRTAMPYGCEVCGEEAEGTFEGTPVCGDCLRDAHDLPPVPTQPRKLYRGLYTDPDNVEQLLSKGLGRFWTDDPKYAEQFARGNGKDFAREAVGYGTTHDEFSRHRPLVVETDWDGTGHTTDLADRFRMDASEYRLDHDTPLTVTRIRQLPEQPGEQERDLLHQPRTHHAKKARTMTATVTVYTKPSCPQCDMTHKLLDRLGVEHDTVDVTADPEAHAYVTGLGYQSAPVVVVNNGEQHWGGFRPDHLKGLAT